MSSSEQKQRVLGLADRHQALAAGAAAAAVKAGGPPAAAAAAGEAVRQWPRPTWLVMMASSVREPTVAFPNWALDLKSKKLKHRYRACKRVLDVNSRRVPVS